MPGTGLIITLGGLIALWILFSGLKARKPKPKRRGSDTGGSDSSFGITSGDRRGDRDDRDTRDNDATSSDSDGGGGDGGGGSD